MAKYEIKTMKKDVEELRKKMKISDSELTGLLGKEKGAPPEKLPVAEPKKPEEPKEIIKPPKPSKPEKLIKPEKPLPPPASPKSKMPKPPRRRKSILPIVIVVLILLIIAGGVYYWWNYIRMPGEEQEIEKPELEIPASSIEVDETKIIEIKEQEDDALFEKLKEPVGQEQELGNFQRILVKKIGKEKDHFLSFQEIAEILYINIPSTILNKLAEEHALFFYSQEEGNRLGVVAKVSDFENLIEDLKLWEKEMQTDLRPIFLGQVFGKSATEEFQDNIYKDIDIRYLNFPDPSLTIDYAVVGDYLVITTSRESMYGVIDRILGE